MRPHAIAETLRKSQSSTAEVAAAVRAMHQRERVRIIEDPYAKFLCGRFWQLVLRIRPLEWFIRGVLRPIAPASMCVLMRARYAEQTLETAIEASITQYVIIGAGMDSFAFRRPDLMDRIDVFEIDHPVTQQKKLEYIRRAGLSVPPRLHFVPTDLSRISALDALAGSGFEISQPTFLTLLGVAYYITADSLTETARSISQHLPAGTLLVIDYLLDEESAKFEHLPMRSRMKSFVARRGELMVSEYSLAAMNDLMAAQDFETVENFALPHLEQQYKEELGTLPFEVPSIFAFGTFRVASRDA
ncbi:MAG: class I SAM-dependent methyltransferase [Truepera sp.]|nr:class I SAM-dependent methyltransferase [Truepera sp.]